MAYTMVHILIAEKVQQKLGKSIDHPTYILGTIAPDAVHAMPDFTVELKERSHLFTEGLRWGRVGKEEEVQPWLDNIKRFYLENRNRYNIDFLLGYIIHLLADVYCSVHFYGPFMQSVQGDMEAAKAQFKKENYDVNYYFFSVYNREKDLFPVFGSIPYAQ